MSDVFFTPVLHPPLGTSTAFTLPNDSTITFTALMTVSTSETSTSVPVTTAPIKTTAIDSTHHFTALLWWALQGIEKWQPAAFTEVVGEQKKSMLVSLSNKKNKSTLRQDLFVLRLELGEAQTRTQLPPLKFCLKYRFHDGPWLWAGSRIGGADGRIVFYQSLLGNESFGESFELSKYFSSPGTWTVDMVKRDKNVQLYHVTTREDVKSLGRPLKLERYMALVKIAAPWMGPVHGGRYFEVDKSTVMTLMLRQDGMVMLVIPAPASAGITPYLVGVDGEVVLKRPHVDGEDTKVDMGVAIVVGHDHDVVMDSATTFLRHLVSKHQGERRETSRAPVEVGREEWERGLSYCTWNGLGADLSEEKILNALETLIGNGIQISNLIIDDNWQSLSNRKYNSSGTLSRFEANEHFPSGLKGLTTKIRARFPFIKHIGVWHALLGYWDGITPNSELSNNYETVNCLWRDNVNSSLRKLTFIHPNDVERFYDDFYGFLSSSGIDCIKADVQSRIDELEDPRDKDLLFQPYHSALAKAARKHFDSRVIYCMAHIPAVLMHVLLPTEGPRKIFRTSDDFYPNVPATHRNHIFTNAHNAHLFSRLHVVQDWDMFSTALSPRYSSLHAAARALSGGPRFITDTPGKHNKEIVDLLMQAVPPVKRAPRAEHPFRAAGDRGLLLMWNELVQGGRVLGVFNLEREAVGELVLLPAGIKRVWSLKDKNVRELGEGETWVFMQLESAGWDVVFLE